MTRKHLTSSIVEEIDRTPKQVFEDMAREPVPSRFKRLPARLTRAGDRKRKALR